jgi:hypothetical protein
MASRLIHESALGLVLSWSAKSNEPSQPSGRAEARVPKQDGISEKDDNDSTAGFHVSQPARNLSSEQHSEGQRTDNRAGYAHHWSNTKRIIVAGIICIYT